MKSKTMSISNAGQPVEQQEIPFIDGRNGTAILRDSLVSVGKDLKW